MPKDKYQETRERWKRENMRQISFRLTRSTEQGMIDWLESHKPIQSYIKGLIREDMNRN